MRLLLVEDDEMLGDALKAGLKQEGYTVEWLSDGQSALVALRHNEFDVVILDLGLPVLSGLEVLKNMRKHGDQTPVLILTARDSVQDRVTGLDSGGDDYLVKPFDLDELNARLRVLIRRQSKQAAPELKHGDIVLNPATHQVTRNGNPVSLSKSEFQLLHYLLTNIGQVVTRNRLEETLYGWEGDIGSNSLEVFIHHLRKKLGQDLIRTIRGIGYMIEK
jgi:two-component system response regulator QseB